jgi:polar amino acid transport system substrate-binding protein
MPLAITRRCVLRLSAAALAGLPVMAHGAGLTMAALKATGTLRIGCTAVGYPPFTVRTEASGLIGYDVDLAQLIWGGEGIKVAFVDVNWGAAITALWAKRLDLIMNGMSYSPERKTWVVFSIPYAEASPVAIIRSRDAGAIRRAEDLDGKAIGVQFGSAGERVIGRLAEQKHLVYREVRMFSEQRDALAALERSQVDAVYEGSPAAAVHMAAAPGKFAIVRSIGPSNWAGMAARPEDVELIAHVDRRLTELKADGQLSRLQLKWFGAPMDLPDKVPNF